MKAVFCETLGTPDGLVVRDIDPPPAPGPGEIKVALVARGVAFTDVLMVAGEYQVKPELPFVVGGEAAGVVRFSHQPVPPTARRRERYGL